MYIYIYSELDAARWTPALQAELGFDRQGALQQVQLHIHIHTHIYIYLSIYLSI